jgi:hypothetical protein
LVGSSSPPVQADWAIAVPPMKVRAMAINNDLGIILNLPYAARAC